MLFRSLTRWDPEDAVFWESEGRSIAARNLWISIPALTLAFAVWMVWSVVVVNLPNIGFKNSFGWAFQAGADVPVGDGPYFLNMDVKKVFMGTHIRASGGPSRHRRVLIPGSSERASV